MAIRNTFPVAPASRRSVTGGTPVTLRLVPSRLVVFAGFLLTALAGCRPAAPVVQPARVISGSMAPHYYGEHWDVTCADCGYTFRIGVESPPDRMLAVCPNCGYAENAVDGEQILPGMAVDVRPQNFTMYPPRRWEVIAFKEPTKTDRIAVKRIVGLPGERIAIRGGDIYADGVLVQKSFEDYADLAQLVCDPDYIPVEGPVGWKSDWPYDASTETRWRAFASDGTEITYRRFPPEQSESFDWLPYRRRRNSAFADTGESDPKIRDDYAYNQGIARSLNVVRDVSITCGIGMNDGGEFRVRLFNAEQPLFVALRPNENTVSLWQDEIMLAEAPTSTPLAQRAGYQLSVAMVDGQVFVVINGEVTLQHQLPSDISARGELSLAFGSRKLDVEVSVPMVFRDIYYLNPHGRADDWEMDAPLANDEYFLLGDNAPISIDSRHYGGIKLSDIVGSVQRRDDE